MTNTHINIGGHKITTNKVGQVHTVTSFDSTYTSSELEWCVINGICYVKGIFRRNATGTDLQPYTSLPKAKIGSVSTSFSNRGYGIVNKNNTILYLTVSTANVDVHVSFVYPVADDWVES